MSNNARRIAIVGSYKKNRADGITFDHIDEAPKAGIALGLELAKRGFSIIVYADNEDFLESDVVKGFTQVEETKILSNCIEVRYPQKIAAPRFKNIENSYLDDDDVRLSYRPDQNDDWEVSFYQSIANIDGMLLLGGGPSALIASLVAISHKKPIAVTPYFGGEASKVWRALANQNMVATEEEVKTMARPWTVKSAESMIAVLDAQIQRREQEKILEAKAEAEKSTAALARENRIKRRSNILVGFSALSLVIVVGFYILILSNAEISSKYWQAIILVAAAFTGIAGATGIELFDRRGNAKRNNDQNIPSIALLGAISGIAAAGLFILAQAFANPVSTESSNQNLLYDRLFLFTSIIGLVAGLTFEKVMKNLKLMNVLESETFNSKPTLASSTDNNNEG